MTSGTNSMRINVMGPWYEPYFPPYVLQRQTITNGKLITYYIGLDHISKGYGCWSFSEDPKKCNLVVFNGKLCKVQQTLDDKLHATHHKQIDLDAFNKFKVLI